jgi:ATP-dependent phosphoenolpyruvate carboxykinase
MQFWTCPQTCPDVPDDILNPNKTWSDATLYDQKAVEFLKNLKLILNLKNLQILKQWREHRKHKLVIIQKEKSCSIGQLFLIRIS